MKLVLCMRFFLQVRWRAFKINMAELLTCVVVECYEGPCFFTVIILDNRDSISKFIYCLILLSLKDF